MATKSSKTAAQLSRGRFGPQGRPLAELSDEDLHQELIDRRRARSPGESKPSWKKLRQYFANLELRPGASLAEVEQAYQRLRDRYHPDKHRDDPERHETARELTESLSEAYQTLVQVLKRG